MYINNQLILDNKNILEMPKEVERMDFLRHISIYNNHLVSLPDYLWNFVNLERLNISGNKFKTIPEEIAKLNLTAEKRTLIC